MTSGSRSYRIGDRIGEFYKVDGLARGGMGIVYFVSDERFAGRRMALKTLRPETMGDPESVLRFAREAELWLALEPHPNVLRLVTLDRVDGHLSILCEHIDGGSLIEWVRGRKFASLADQLKVAFAISDGMAHIHARGMLHRDLKPANVLMTKEGIPKVCDLGLARPLAPGDTIIRPAKPGGGGPQSESSSGVSLGTPNYMPPEQWLDARKAGPAADVYAFGATLYEVIYGHKVFQVPRDFAEVSGMNWLKKSHMEVPPTFPPEVILPAGLQDLLATCLAKKPEARVKGGFEGVCERLSSILQDFAKARPVRSSTTTASLDAVARFYRGFGWTTLNRRNMALDEYSAAVAADPACVPALANRGVCRKEMGDIAGALADYTKAIELKPDYALAYTNRGVVKAQRGDRNGALEDFTRALQLKPDDAVALGNRASIRIDLKDPKGALDDAAEAVRLRPDWPNAFNTRGLAHRILGNADSALADFTKAIELRADYLLAWYNRAVTKSSKGDDRGAIDDFSKVLSIDPNDVQALYNRGSCRAEINDFPNAAADFDKAIQVKADFAPAYFGRANANLNRGRKAQAKADLEQFLQLAPNHRLADQAKEWLKGL